IHVPVKGGETTYSPVSMPGGRVTVFKAGGKGIVWGATADGLFKWFDGRLEEIRSDTGNRIAGIQQMVLAKEGQLWLYGSRRGLYDLEGRVLHAHVVPELDGKQILAMTIDRSGQLWMSVADGTLVVKSAKIDSVRVYDRQDGLIAGPYSAILEGDDGTI